jgi:hypothetical protein
MENNMHKSVKVMLEGVSKKLLEANDDPASNLLSLLAAPDFTQYMDKLADRLSDREFMAVKNLYNNLYAELKKHE